MDASYTSASLVRGCRADIELAEQLIGFEVPAGAGRSKGHRRGAESPVGTIKSMVHVSVFPVVGRSIRMMILAFQ